MIRTAQLEDINQLLAIYNHYVSNTIATLDHDLMTLKQMKTLLKSVLDQYLFLVFEEEGKIQAYAYASAWKSKHGYKNAVESTIYLNPEAVGKGIGTRLYYRLIQDLKKQGFQSVIAGLSLPNTRSVALHEKLGYIKVAHFGQIGEKFGKRVDVGYWQLNF